jgi:hypothetical protein
MKKKDAPKTQGAKKKHLQQKSGNPKTQGDKKKDL